MAVAASEKPKKEAANTASVSATRMMMDFFFLLFPAFTPGAHRHD